MHNDINNLSRTFSVAYMCMIRVEHLVMDSQLGCSFLGKTNFFLFQQLFRILPSGFLSIEIPWNNHQIYYISSNLTPQNQCALSVRN